ncbi:DNA ligase D [Amaricoccus solimangrovi]|uniref:DNA ligase (ATP) n=1 Tax=Amaricoccus solimangrovi TaxID=2589815 RepID=A0A501X112_9RHOB|nr:DNA ligase D [Amaricoccus solimangrovi]TPE52976.1 DNA ligase D [Amaricoccus solimangrovi]
MSDARTPRRGSGRDPSPGSGDGDALETYRRKRDFGRTAEPAGGAAPAAGHRFVVHKHHASSAHYDLRLELDGVLLSWAVPKGPSLDPADRRLAIRVEDHPLDYADFEGVIPEGSYGAGPTLVWDAGEWAPAGDARADLDKGALKFRLAGEKLRGGWMLARMKPKRGERRIPWLLIKEKDFAAAPGSDILAERPESVKSGRRIEDLIAPAPPPAPAKAPPPRRLRPGASKGARKAAMPATLPPQLATLADAPPDGRDWLHEMKFDGYRTMAFVEEGAARLVTRGGLDWTRRYGDLGAAFAALPCRAAVIDGEVVALDEKGVSRFALLQSALSDGPGGRLTFFAFDLLHLDGWDLTEVRLERRKALLAALLGPAPPAAIRLSDHVAGDGPAFFARAGEMGLEGVVSKRADAPYRPGRSRSWLKAKAPRTGDFTIAGYTASPRAGGLGALALGEWDGDELHYRGKVGTGFDEAAMADLLARLEPLRAGAPPLPEAPREVIPVRPVLTARIRYASRTGNNWVRHAVFLGLRGAATGRKASAPARGTKERMITEADLATISITNPDRRLFGRSGPTKLDVALYYARIGEAMLPHLLRRPVSLVRCPSGKSEDCFFQRHPFTGMPKALGKVAIGDSDGESKIYLTIDDAAGYLALAQFGVVEFHCWGARKDDVEHPDRVILDLDPGAGIGWREIVHAATHVGAELRAMGLVPFVKTSGGKGVHVVVPVTRRLGWKATHAASAAIAEAIAKTAPETFVTVMGERNRRNRIFIDFHRNARAATAVAPYSLRARGPLPASAPLDWADLETVEGPEDLNHATLPGLVAAAGDPWATIEDEARDLPEGARDR